MSGKRAPARSYLGLKPKQATAAGAVLTALGSWLLFEGYELAGRPRPWLLRFLPGP